MAQLSRCKKAELTDAVSKQKIAAGVSSGALDSLMLAVPAESVLDLSGPVPVRFLDPVLGVITCLCRLTAPLSPGDKRFTVYRCQVLEQLSQEQRREDIKIPLDIQVAVTLASTEAVASAVLRDISAGGVYLTTSLAARPKDYFSFVFRRAGPPIPLTAQILRAEMYPALGVMGYGCRFVHLSPGHEAQLRAYIFQEERRQRKS